jgi:hypothetical protein
MDQNGAEFLAEEFLMLLKSPLHNLLRKQR